MNDTLKAAGRIGAELGAAKAEVDRLREVLSRIANLPMYHCSTENDYRLSAAKAMAVAALSQQPEPTDTYTAVDMATAAAQGFRDGQAAVEQDTAQDEREAFDAWREARGWDDPIMPREIWTAALEFAATRPAQTEQQPVMFANAKELAERSESPCCDWSATDYCTVPLYAATVAQTAPLGKFRMGDLVKKSTGSEWVGRVVGWYSTEQTKEGYAVESSAHRNSVQIYPVTALEAVE